MPSSPARKARRNQLRRMQAMGIELAVRGHVQTDATVDVIAWEVARVVKELAMQGADMDASLAVTVGEHPSFPGVITIEGKAAKKAPLPDIAVPPATEDDLVQHFRKTLGIESDDDE